MTEQIDESQIQNVKVLPGDSSPITLPSGETVNLMEIVLGVPSPMGEALRFRFLAPFLDQKKLPDDVLFEDIFYLCAEYALKKIDGVSPNAQQIIISLSEAPLAFGQASDDIAQYFEAFSRQGQTCEWDAF
ncbi:MAG: hypothetical protein ACI9O0_001224 [Paracoccaceae bacterium]|jgi:hypothetical protein